MKNRIQILDGFRALAILSVVLYHFFSRWASLYPYGSRYDHFEHGASGVQFFFLISGFVIYFTLENTDTFKAFWIKRFIRLFPSMLFASILTFAIIRLFDRSGFFWQSHQLRYLVGSWTFISPSVFHFFHINLGYTDGSYWSLWPEVEFYLFSSTLFFLNRKNFFRNFIITSAILIAAREFIFKHEEDAYPGLLVCLPFFAMGALFYQLWKIVQLNRKPGALHYFGLAFFAGYMLYSADVLVVRVLYALMISLFFVFIYAPRFLGFLTTPVITKIGTSSYFLYLIHQNIGVLAINKFAGYFEPFGFVCTILLIVGLIAFSIWFTEKVEKKFSGMLKTLLLRSPSKPKPASREFRQVVSEDQAR